MDTHWIYLKTSNEFQISYQIDPRLLVWFIENYDGEKCQLAQFSVVIPLNWLQIWYRINFNVIGVKLSGWCCFQWIWKVQEVVLLFHLCFIHTGLTTCLVWSCLNHELWCQQVLIYFSFWSVTSVIIFCPFRFICSRETGALSRTIDRGSRAINFILSSMVFNVVPTILEVGFYSSLTWIRALWNSNLWNYLRIHLLMSWFLSGYLSSWFT